MHHGTGREPLIYITLTTLLLTLLAIGMAVGVVLAVSALLYFQVCLSRKYCVDSYMPMFSDSDIIFDY